MMKMENNQPSKAAHPISGWRASPDESAAGTPSTDVWDHGMVYPHQTHLGIQQACEQCGIKEGTHGRKGEPRASTQRAAGAPSTDTRHPLSCAIWKHDRGRGHDCDCGASSTAYAQPVADTFTVHLPGVDECDECGALVRREAMIRHRDWHLDMRD